MLDPGSRTASVQKHEVSKQADRRKLKAHAAQAQPGRDSNHPLCKSTQGAAAGHHVLSYPTLRSKLPHLQRRVDATSKCYGFAPMF